jgi:hypothetical protein
MMAMLWCFRTHIVKKYAIAFNKWRLNAMSMAVTTRTAGMQPSPKLIYKSAGTLNEYAESETDFSNMSFDHAAVGRQNRRRQLTKQELNPISERVEEPINNDKKTLEDRYRHVLDSSDEEEVEDLQPDVSRSPQSSLSHSSSPAVRQKNNARSQENNLLTSFPYLTMQDTELEKRRQALSK